MNIDTVDVSFEFAEGTPVKRFRKGTHLFNVHSWALHQVAQRGSNTHAQNLLQLPARDVALEPFDR